MKSFLVVNPWIHDFAAFDFWLKPLGLLRIAGCLIKSGAEVFLLDFLDRNHPWLPSRTKTDSWGRGKFFRETIEKPTPLEYVPRSFSRYGLPYDVLLSNLENLPDVDAILVTSSMTYWYTGVVETIELLRQRYRETPVILGGTYASILPHHARQYSGADQVVAGSLEDNWSLMENFLGLKLNRTRCMPAWNLYPRLDYGVITISNGCPFRCTYCASWLLNPQFACRDIQSVVDELRALADMGIRNICFYDDALLFHPEFDDLLGKVINMKASFQFHTPNGLHVTRITRQRAELMHKAGFTTLYLSLESIDPVLLERTGGKLSPQAFDRTVRILKETGFEPDNLHAYILFGLPRQTVDSVKKTIDCAVSAGVTPHLAEFSPVHRTLDFQRCGLDSNADPLLTNNTAWCSRESLIYQWKLLKQYMHDL